jgi:two-component sensor histidine kinase
MPIADCCLQCPRQTVRKIRVKNKIAAVHAILGHELRDNTEVWEKVSGRLRALATTDEFLTRSDERSVQLSDILQAELDPYDRSRASLHGDPVELPAKLAANAWMAPLVVE